MKYLKFLTLLILPFAFSHTSFAQAPAYQITATIGGWDGQAAYLGYRRGDKVFSRDTAELKDGRFTFEGSEPLPPGIYLMLMPPENRFFEFVVMPGEQHFSMAAQAPDFNNSLTFTGSDENVRLQAYQAFMSEKVTATKQLQAQLKEAGDDAEQIALEKQLAEIGTTVRAHQDELAAQHPGSYAALLIKAFQEPVIPEPPPGDDGTFIRQFFKKHYFDGFDFSREVFVNSPYLKQKIDFYLSGKMTAQLPDSVIVAVDFILDKVQANEEAFRWALPYLLNKYFVPDIMGLDAVFVHISDKYYATGRAGWVSEDNLKKITDDAYMIRGVLLGKKAADVLVQPYDRKSFSFSDSLISLYSVQADYTVVFLWKPGCGHCKKITDELIPFYQEWKDKGVEIFSITSANHSDLDKAISDITHKKMPWIVTADPYMRARALQKFYGTSLPKIYLLGKDKKIIANRVSPAQLPKIIEAHKRMTQEENR
jgi:thiol-disulfide isomerase/thioredoxin